VGFAQPQSYPRLCIQGHPEGSKDPSSIVSDKGFEGRVCGKESNAPCFGFDDRCWTSHGLEEGTEIALHAGDVPPIATQEQDGPALHGCTHGCRGFTHGMFVGRTKETYPCQHDIALWQNSERRGRRKVVDEVAFASEGSSEREGELALPTKLVGMPTGSSCDEGDAERSGRRLSKQGLTIAPVGGEEVIEVEVTRIEPSCGITGQALERREVGRHQSVEATGCTEGIVFEGKAPCQGGGCAHAEPAPCIGSLEHRHGLEEPSSRLFGQGIDRSTLLSLFEELVGMEIGRMEADPGTRP